MSASFETIGHVVPELPRTYCFAHAGGLPRAFLAWQPECAGVTTLVAVSPGPGPIDVLFDRVAAAIAAREPAPFVLFGHSLGALIAFEVGRRLRERTGHVVASGCAAPALHPTARMREVAGLAGPRLADAVRDYGGLPPEVLADPELRDFVLPAVRDDFRLIAGYRHRPAVSVPFAVSLVNGTHDPIITPADLDGWSAECEREPERIFSPGGHFYFTENQTAVVDVIRRAAQTLHVELI